MSELSKWEAWIYPLVIMAFAVAGYYQHNSILEGFVGGIIASVFVAIMITVSRKP
jgi:hypothetical protein